MASEYDALLSPPTQPKSEYDALLAPSPQPTQTFAHGSPREIAREQLASQPVVQQQMERAGRAIAGTAEGFVKSLPSLAKFIKPPSLTDILTGASETVGQIKQAEQAPVGSQEWWNAVVPIASQYAMQFGGVRASSPRLTETLFGEKPPVQEAPLAAEQAARTEVIKNATQPNRETGALPTEQGKPLEPETKVQPQARDTRQTPPQTPAQEVVPEAAAVSGAETPPAAAPKIISTAVNTPEGIQRGEGFEPHDAIIQRLGAARVATEKPSPVSGGEKAPVATPQGIQETQKGFIIREPDGTERFTNDRTEAAGIAKAAGQVKPEHAGTTELHSQQLAEPVSVGGEGATAATLAEQKPAGVSGLEPPTAAVPPPPVSSSEPHVSAIANRFTQERVKSGEIGEIAPGQGHSTQELVQRGLKMSPEEVTQHVSDLQQGTGDIVKQGQAVRAEEARLTQRSNQLSREAEADPTNTEKKLAADNAFKDLTDFHNGPIATLKNKWHQTGMEMQGEIPVDLSTYNGMREAWLKDIGTPPPPEAEPILRETAKKVATANSEANGAIQKVGQSIDKVTRGRKLPDYETVRNNILERLKQRAPCN